MSGHPLHPRVVLASQSPRRAELLAMLGIAFETVPADVDERYLAGESPAGHVERLARAKAERVAARETDAVTIGSDTIVVIDDVVLGKPSDAADAVRMLLLLQGREHDVMTGLAVVAEGRTRSAVEHVRVRFRAFDDAVATAYAGTGEPLDKAGAYGIQGRGSTLVEGIRGDYFAVMGLPIARLMLLLQESGLRYNFRDLTRAEVRT